MTISFFSSVDEKPLSFAELNQVNAWWRAANYLSVGQVYLLANPLLHAPLKPEQVKSRLVGHWGTCPGLNLIYAHLNRLIRKHGENMPAIRDWKWPGWKPKDRETPS